MKISYWLSSLLVVLSLCSLQRAQAGSNDPSILDKGPADLIIVYKCAPENRLALRRYMETRGMADMARWKAAGVFADDTILFSRSTDTDNWDMQVFLRFAVPQDAARWNQVEQSQPAGLQPEALRLVSAISTYWLDLVESGGAAAAAKSPVYLTIPYEVTIPKADYITYVHQYLIPQTQGWIAAGVLHSYKVYVIRNSAGRPWSALLLLEYMDDAGLGARDKVVKDVREKLKGNPAWNAISDHKESVRTEKAPIVATALNKAQ